MNLQKLYIGLTDTGWFNYLFRLKPEDVNFWQPGGHSTFKALERGAPFLFKLKYPDNAIGGVGFFVSYERMPLSLAWNTFGAGNGSVAFEDFKKVILNYRADNGVPQKDPEIGCIILTSPIFFEKKDWIPAPEDWKKNIVSGKSYDMNSSAGRAIWEQVETLLVKYHFYDQPLKEGEELIADPSIVNRYGNYLSKVRIGQGTFRLLISDIYRRRCAISGERTLPVLEAAHIKPYAASGPHAVQNGLLLRSDLHKLFDAGYVTVTEEHYVEVSNSIREQFENGRDYYRYHGQRLIVLPDQSNEKPGGGYLKWHNENVYRG